MADDQPDAFISYSSKDREWAEKLCSDLKSKGFVPYLDRDRLVAGDIWPKKLYKALKQSRHLIVLWSENASKSDWVHQEYYRFDQIQQDLEKNGRTITILLENTKLPYTSIEVIKDLQKKGAYAEGFATLDENLWQEVMMQVEEALKADDSSMPISLGIITTTKERLAKINPDEGPEYGIASLNSLLNSLKLGTIDNLLQYYGETRKDWKPFGGSTGKNIMTIMNDLRDEINLKNKDDKFRWEPINEIFWSILPEDQTKVEREAEKILPPESDPKGLSVVVIDPISFYDRLVENRFNSYIYRGLSNSKCLIMILPPFPIPKPNSGLREFLRYRLTQVYNHFFLYAERSTAAANLNLYISEDLDIKRFLLWALKSQIQLKETMKSSSPFTNFGQERKP